MMTDQRDMPKVDLDKDEKLDKEAKVYARFIEAKNFIRAAHAKKVVRNNRLIFGGCLTLIVAFYGFTIIRVKQETFLDDFEEPPRVIRD